MDKKIKSNNITKNWRHDNLNIFFVMFTNNQSKVHLISGTFFFLQNSRYQYSCLIHFGGWLIFSIKWSIKSRTDWFPMMSTPQNGKIIYWYLAASYSKKSHFADSWPQSAPQEIILLLLLLSVASTVQHSQCLL